MADAARCYACGAAAAVGADPRNPLCGPCAPVRDHVVSMQRGPGGVRVGVCRCGWREDAGHDAFREAAIANHWRAVVAASSAAPCQVAAGAANSAAAALRNGGRTKGESEQPPGTR